MPDETNRPKGIEHDVKTSATDIKKKDTPDQKAEKGDTSAPGRDVPKLQPEHFGTPDTKTKAGGAGAESVEVEPGKALSKEELLQKPTGTGKVKVGGKEATLGESEALIERAKEILEEYGGQESNVPVDSEYWALMNKHRALAKDEREVTAREQEQKRLDQEKK